MSISVSGTKITMTRGDTLKVKVNLFDCNGNEYIPDSNDKLRFALKKSYSDKIPLIQKSIPTDSCILQLNPRDTKFLKQPGSYVYDIQITFSNGFVDTFISDTITLTEEVE